MPNQMGLIGRKLGMTQVFHEGHALGCTVLELGPCTVTGVRSPETHGYSAVQLGLGAYRSGRATRSVAGQFKTLSLIPRVVREIRLDADPKANFQLGQVLKATDVFKSGDVVDAIGQSKGKGYQGVMKRHNMSGKPAAHGTHEMFRNVGSIGCRLTPGRVFKGKRMTGHMGDERCTASNLVVVQVLADKNVVLVKGAIPGPRNAVVVLKGSMKNVRKTIIPLPEKEQESKNPMKASKKGA
jgi:large subunit ribosomal protein L3